MGTTHAHLQVAAYRVILVNKYKMPRLFLGNLGHDCRERDIEKFFHGYGDLKHVNIKGPYGFVELDDKRDAEDAIRDLNGKSFNGGSRIRIEYAQGNDRGGERDRRGGGGFERRDNRGGGDRSGGRQVSDGKFKRTNYRLVVENLSSRTSWQDLKDFMRKAGDITYTTVNRGNRGEGLVEFTDREGMEYAIKELDDTKLDGNRIRLTEERKGGSRSRSRSNRRGNRRSNSRGNRRSGSRSNSRKRRSPEKSRKGRSPTPDEKSRSRSRSEDRARNEDRTKDEGRRSQEKRGRQRSGTPEERSRSRSDNRAKNSERGSNNGNGRPASRTPEEKERSRSRSRSNEAPRKEERYESRSPAGSGSERE